MDEELRKIVERMVAAGESEQNIALVIRNFNGKSVKKKENTPSITSPSKPLEESGSSFLSAVNFNKQNDTPTNDAVILAMKRGEENNAQEAIRTEAKQDNSFLNPMSNFGKTITIKDAQGKNVNKFISLENINAAYPTLNLDDNAAKSVVDNMQHRVDKNETTQQDFDLLFFSDKGVKSNKLTATDNARINSTFVQKGLTWDNLDDTKNLESINKVIKDIENNPEAEQNYGYQGASVMKVLSVNQKDQIQNLKDISSKITSNLVVNKKYDKSEVEGVAREENDGNMLTRFGRDLSTILENAGNPVGAILGTNKGTEALFGKEFNDERVGLKEEFLMGLEYYKYQDPTLYERVKSQYDNKKPMSQSQIAAIENKGAQLMKQRADQALINKEIDIPTYSQERVNIQQKVLGNTYKNKEVLRSTLAGGIGNKYYQNQSDETKRGAEFSSFDFGIDHVSDKEIDAYGKEYAKEIGLDENDPKITEALQFLKDNEGVFLMQNSIPKDGIVRDILQGGGGVIRGINSFVNGQGGNDAYIQGQSDVNVNAADQAIDAEKKGFMMYRKKIAEGLGQFAVQAGLAYGGGAVVGGIGRGALALGTDAALTTEAGVAASELTTAGEIITPTLTQANAITGVEAALADVGTIARSLNQGQNITNSLEAANGFKVFGNGILKGQDFISTFGTTYAQSYDANYKQAQNYTSDDAVAHKIAMVQSGVDALSENLLSPLETVKNVAKLGRSSSTLAKDLVKVFTEGNLIEQKSALKTVLSSTLKGVGTGAEVVLN
jgi:hypothetical protein